MAEAMLRISRKVFGAYAAAMEVLAAFALAAIVVITTTQIVYRYFLSGSLVWAEELSRCLMVWICFLFLGIAYRRGEIASVELIDRLPRRLRALLIIPAMALTVMFLGIIAYHGWIYANQNMMQTLPGLNVLWRQLTGSTSGVSIFWVYLSIPIGMVLLALHVVGSAVRLFDDAFRSPASAGRS